MSGRPRRSQVSRPCLRWLPSSRWLIRRALGWGTQLVWFGVHGVVGELVVGEVSPHIVSHQPQMGP